MKRAQVTMQLVVTFDPDRTTPEALASALDAVLETVIAVDDLSEYGPVDLGPVETGAEVRIVSDTEGE